MRSGTGTTSPPPIHNFDVEPTVTHLDEWWHRKYETDENHKPRRRATIEYLSDPGFDASGVHLPSPSYWPIIVAAGLPLIGFGMIYTYWLAALGGLMVLGGIYGWGLEPSVDPDAGHEEGHREEVLPPGEPVAVGASEETE